MSKLKTMGIPLTTGVVGAAAGGPVGLAIGLAVGLGLDLVIAKKQGRASAIGTVAPSLSPSTAPDAMGLPPSANLAAASSAVHMIALGTAMASSGKTGLMGMKGGAAEKPAAMSYLKTFQSSVGLPATGALDPQTRALLVAATRGTANDASKLPAVTILG